MKWSNSYLSFSILHQKFYNIFLNKIFLSLSTNNFFYKLYIFLLTKRQNWLWILRWKFSLCIFLQKVTSTNRRSFQINWNCPFNRARFLAIKKKDIPLFLRLQLERFTSISFEKSRRLEELISVFIYN